MTDKLFVYGTLGLGRPNEHILNNIGGTWEIGSVRGILKNEGWGAAIGFSGLELDECGNEIDGFVFTSENLTKHWTYLDEFEGAAYQRVVTQVQLKNGNSTYANINKLR